MRLLKFLFNAKKWVPCKDAWSSLLALISRDQIEHVHEYKFQKDIKFALISQIIIRHSLNLLLDAKWTEIKIEKNSHGRPHYVNEITKELVDFNVSHNGDYLACVACVSSDTNFKVGVDIMQVLAADQEKRYLRMKRIIKKYFSLDEQDYIESRANSNAKFQAAMRIWALKESYVKSLGMGIGFDIRRINLKIPSEFPSTSTLFTSDTQIQVNCDLVKACRFEEHFIDSHFITTCFLTDEIMKVAEFQEVFVKDFLLSERIISNLSERDQETYWNNFNSKDYSNARD